MQELMQAVHTQTPELSLPSFRGHNPGLQPSRSNETFTVSPLIRRLSSNAVRLSDLAWLSLALLASLFRASLAEGSSVSGYLSLRISIQNLFLGVAVLLVWRGIFWSTGLYQPRLTRRLASFLWRVPLTAALCTAALLPLLIRSLHTVIPVVHAAVSFWIVGTAMLFTTRAAFYSYDEHVRPLFRKHRTLIVVGTGPRACAMAARLLSHPNFRYEICGFVDSNPQEGYTSMGKLLGGVSDLENILMRHPVDEVMISLPLKSSFGEVEEVMSICGRAGVKAQYSLDLFHTSVAKHQDIDESTGVRVVEMVHNDERLILKYSLDRIAAALGLLLLSPVLLVIAAGIKLTSKGPVFFVQQRWGQNKRPFGMIKFRSMVVDAEARMEALEKQNEFGGPMFKMRNDPRITRVGAFLRRTSLDELPQLLNVLRGEMSLVGPRPLPLRDVQLFSEPWLMRRFSVKPGITGLWQVSGRSATGFQQTIQLDLRYIDTWNLFLDMQILAQTLRAVIRGDGAY